MNVGTYISILNSDRFIRGGMVPKVRPVCNPSSSDCMKVLTCPS